MNASYSIRLLFLCLQVFVIVHFALGLLLSATAPLALRLASRLKPKEAARFLYVLRLLPVLAAVSGIVFVCVPSYLLLEPDHESERVGYFSIVLVSIACFEFGAAARRSVRALRQSRRYLRDLEQLATVRTIAGGAKPVWEIPAESPFLAMMRARESVTTVKRIADCAERELS